MQMGTWSDYLQDQTTAVDPVSELNPGIYTGPISTVYFIVKFLQFYDGKNS